MRAKPVARIGVKRAAVCVPVVAGTAAVVITASTQLATANDAVVEIDRPVRQRSPGGIGES